MSKLITLILDIAFYGILISQIGNPANTVGIQILLILVMIVFGLSEIAVRMGFIEHLAAYTVRMKAETARIRAEQELAK